MATAFDRLTFRTLHPVPVSISVCMLAAIVLERTLHPPIALERTLHPIPAPPEADLFEIARLFGLSSLFPIPQAIVP
ncbi:MAG: hypothetical protein AB4426_16405 [Xenococcaceae cyanobacterium]